MKWMVWPDVCHSTKLTPQGQSLNSSYFTVASIFYCCAQNGWLCFLMPLLYSVPWFSVQAGSAGLPAENCPVLSSAQHLQQGESWGSESGWRAHRVWGKSIHTEQHMASSTIADTRDRSLGSNRWTFLCCALWVGKPFRQRSRWSLEGQRKGHAE